MAAVATDAAFKTVLICSTYGLTAFQAFFTPATKPSAFSAIHPTALPATTLAVLYAALTPRPTALATEPTALPTELATELTALPIELQKPMSIPCVLNQPMN
jgi:hypothetical protein